MMKKKQATKRTKTSDARRRELATIHIGKKSLGLDDDTYKEMLRNIAGAQSAGDLDAQGRAMIIEHLKSCGFKPVHRSAKKSGMHVAPAKERQPLLSMIGAILADLELPWSYADGIAKRMYKVEKVRWLYPDQLQKLAGVLIAHQKKVKGGDTES